MPSMRPVALAATALALLGAASASAGEPAVRITPEVIPMQVAAQAGKAGAGAAKPAAVERIPGPVITTHARVNAAGELETWCSDGHAHAAIDPLAPGQEQQR